MAPITTMEKARARELKEKLNETIMLMRADIEGSEDPQLAVLCETSAEVLRSLVTVIEHYEAGEEKAWR
jgi:hypothetical protein